jgi:hypothetical protein
MIVILDYKTLVSSLPNMAASAVMLVITTNMACHQPLHHFVQLVGLFWLNEQVEMVWHQAPCVQSHRKLCPRLLHYVNECPKVTVFMKNLLSAVTAIDKVVAGVVG